MATVVPAVIPRSRTHLEETLARISPWTREVQIDIVDGNFVPFTSWPYTEEGNIEDLAPLCRDFHIEVDLMIERPEEQIEAYLRAGAERMVIHLESTEHLEDIIEQKSRHTFQLGFSILNDTDLAVLAKELQHADFVQFMGIKDIGTQGQPFDERVLARIREFKSMHPQMPVSVDGSVNTDTAVRLKEAGAERLISGSAILGAPEPRAVYEAMTKSVGL